MTLTIDTNILVYAVDPSAGSRHARAADIVARVLACGSGVLMLQALAEFYSVATRKLGTRPADARNFIADLCAVLPVRLADDRALAQAMLAAENHGLAFWDALLWAAADLCGVRYLLSEDFQDRRVLGAVTFVNPFEASNQELLDRELAPVRPHV